MKKGLGSKLCRLDDSSGESDKGEAIKTAVKKSKASNKLGSKLKRMVD